MNAPLGKGRIENGVLRTIEQMAEAARAPAYRSQAWQDEMRRHGRLMFINGNATPGGDNDNDKTAEINSGDDYEATPRQGQT